MGTWTSDELAKIAADDELQIAFLRRDGTLSSERTIWVVRIGADLYVRSVNGPSSAWFRGVQLRHQGRIEAGGINRDVTFEAADPALNDQVDVAYADKYRSRYPGPVQSVTRQPANGTTLRLVPS